MTRSAEWVVSRVNVVESGCWEWTGVKHRDGYGFGTEIGGRIRPAHRMAYETLVGPIPDGLQLDHLCRNRICVNPEHLEPVTPRINTLRGLAPSAFNAVKTCCPQGHPYDEANTYLSRAGERHCRACHRVQNREYARRKRAMNA